MEVPGCLLPYRLPAGGVAAHGMYGAAASGADRHDAGLRAGAWPEPVGVSSSMPPCCIGGAFRAATVSDDAPCANTRPASRPRSRRSPRSSLASSINSRVGRRRAGRPHRVPFSPSLLRRGCNSMVSIQRRWRSSARQFSGAARQPAEQRLQPPAADQTRVGAAPPRARRCRFTGPGSKATGYSSQERRGGCDFVGDKPQDLGRRRRHRRAGGAGRQSRLLRRPEPHRRSTFRWRCNRRRSI